jgi:hypothetical protein
MKHILNVLFFLPFPSTERHMLRHERGEIDFGYDPIVDREKGSKNRPGLRSSDQFGERMTFGTLHTGDFHHGSSRSDMKPRHFVCQTFTDPKWMRGVSGVNRQG